MDKIDLLICGLGNPGSKYENTRHNVGWMAADAIAKELKCDFIPASPIYWLASDKYAGKNILICKPTTYMNNSGEAVRKIKDKYALSISQILILVDEYNFPLGKVHIKKGGSGGGHNGVISIIEELDDNNFYSMRLGIDKKFESGGMVDYVLSNFEEEEKEMLEIMLGRVVKSIKVILKTNINRAASDINSGRLFEDITKTKSENEATAEKS